MVFLKLLLSLGTIIALAQSYAIDINWNKRSITPIDYRFLNYVKPIHYNIKFILNIEEGIYFGKSSINIEIIKKTQYILLHSMNMDITETTLIRDNGQLFKNNDLLIYKPKEYSYNEETNIFVIYFQEKLLPGYYILNIEFFNEITNTEGLFRTSYNNSAGKIEWLFVTNLQKSGARQLFPCWDDPKLKANYTISIKHSANYAALSNMPIKNKTHENNMIWTHFQTTPKMSPNLVAIVATSLFSLSDAKGTRMWHIRNKTSLFISFFYTHLFSTTLEKKLRMISLKKIPKVDYMAIPDFSEEVVSTWGFVFYREAKVSDNIMSIYNITHEIIKVLRFIARSVIQEILNDVLPWLNEGLTKYLENYVIHKSLEFHQIMNTFVVQDQYESFRLNSENLVPNITSEINSLHPSLRYIKAFSILRMLQYLLTDKVFRYGIIKYLHENKYNIQGTPNDFWIAVQDALNEAGNKNEINLIKRMNNWIKPGMYPIVKVTCGNVNSAYISVENVNSIDSDLWIPVTYTTQKNPDFFKTSLRDVVWLKLMPNNHSFIELPEIIQKDDWIIINLQQAGYYRVIYDVENWKKIAKYLNSTEYTKIHVFNRAQIIDDAFYFVTTDRINSSVFWELTSYLSREINYVAWYPMFKALEYMSSILPLPDTRVFNIKIIMQKIFFDLLNKIEYQESNENIVLNYLRQEAAKWACVFDEPNCKITANSKLQHHLKSRTTYELTSWWEEWTYCNGLMTSDENTWNEVLNIYMKEFNYKYLKFLACCENSAIIQKYMMEMATKYHNGVIKEKDYISSFLFIIAKHAKNSIIVDYILVNFETIIPRSINKVAILIELINHVYYKQQLDKIYQFAKNYEKHNNLQTKRFLEHKINKRLFEIKNQMDYVGKFLHLGESMHA